MNDKDLMKKLYMTINEEIELKAQELVKSGIEFKPFKNTTDEDIEEFRKSLGLTDSWHIEINANPAERKKWLMMIDKEHLVDMVFDLESRNEFLLHNLSEVEKMYNKLKEEVENG